MSGPYHGVSNTPGVAGLVGENTVKGAGVWGSSKGDRGVVGVSVPDGAGAWGECPGGRGVVGVSKTGVGVWGESGDKTTTVPPTLIAGGRGVVGIAAGSDGVWGEATTTGVAGDVSNPFKPGRGVVGIGHGNGSIGVFGEGTGFAGSFNGNVIVRGKLTVTGDIENKLLAALAFKIMDLEKRVHDLDGKQAAIVPG